MNDEEQECEGSRQGLLHPDNHIRYCRKTKRYLEGWPVHLEQSSSGLND